MDKEQFDEFLGGTVELPRDVQIIRLATARATEIAAMTYSIENPQQSKLVFQKLPVHMRRRVMSHNAKRMPRRLREAHSRQMTKSGLPPERKRPSRKYRRRPGNLSEEYNRRKRKCAWLETHLWHAKRFRTVEKWGYKIAESPNDRSSRACYRAAAEHCLIRDLSYYSCFEIKGPRDYLVKTLRAHCDPANLTFAAKIYRDGSREGRLVFFEKNGYPRSPIGTVSFSWASDERPEYGTIRIWVHPLVYEHFLSEIVRSFDFRVIRESGEKESGLKYPLEYENDANCAMTNLRDALNRFSLTGPLSLAVATDALRLPNSCTGLLRNDEVTDSTRTSRWYENFYQDPRNLERLRVQRERMDDLRSLKSPDQLPPNCVMAMTVLDPRFFFPKKRTKKRGNGEYYAKIEFPGNQVDKSPLWDPEVRRCVKEERKTGRDIDKLRSENLIPGVYDDEQFDEKIISKIPVIMIQNPGFNGGRKRLGFASGVDIVVPAGWSMPFWQAFVLRCARAGGLAQSRLIAFETLDTDSPDMIPQPDVPSHIKEALVVSSELRAKYFRYPPNRRVNFTKFGISSPFYCEWSILVREWTNIEGYYVMRDRRSLEILGRALSCPRGKNKNANGRKISSESVLDESVFSNLNCLVPVKISLEGKGRARNFAIICIPTEEDLKNRATRKKWSGPVQKLVADPNERARRELRKNHKVILARSNRRSRRSGKLAREAANAFKLKKRTKAQSRKDSNDRNFAIKKEYRGKMEELYLPKCQRVRDSCDRPVMGYVVRGDFSFSEARGIGIGYVTLASLRSIVNSRIDSILVRNTQTRQYRFARIEMINYRC